MVIDKEIIDGFKEETNSLLVGLNEIIEDLEDTEEDFPEELLENFSQQIDRIMGSAATINMMAPDHPAMGPITRLSELCKKMGYNAVAAKKGELVNLFAAFWADVVEVLSKLVNNFEDEEKLTVIVQKETAYLQKRLEWLYAKIPKLVYDKPQEGDTAEVKEKKKKAASAGKQSQAEIDDFLKSLLG